MPLDKWTSGKDYDAWMGRWSRLLAKEFLVWLNIPAGARWLDVCCGTGITTQAIVEHTSPASVAGIYVNTAQMEVARLHHVPRRGRCAAFDERAARSDAASRGLGRRRHRQCEKRSRWSRFFDRPNAS